MKNKIIFYISCVFITSLFSGDFVKGEKRVIDTKNNIMWQDNIEVTQYVEDSIMADVYCSELILNGYTDWKLPSIEQLISTLDIGVSPSISKEFKYTSKNKYISTTKFILDKNKLWYIDFTSGKLSYGLNSDKYNIRCIRDIK